MVLEKKIFLCFSHDTPGAGPVWTPGARLAGFIKRNTIHCYKQNMKALGLVVSEKFFYVLLMTTLGGARMDPRGTVGRLYKEGHYTMLLTKYESSRPCGCGEEDFFMFFRHCKSMGANDPRGGAIFDPRGMIGRIYIEDHLTLLHTKYEIWSLWFWRRRFFYVFPRHPEGRASMDHRGTVGRIYKEDHYTLLHTKYESSGPCGFGEEDF